MKIALTVGGSDPSAGAGIQSDIKTFQSLGVYGVSVVTAVTSQNTREFLNFLPLDRKVVRSQFEAIMNDIQVDVTKTGMLGTTEIVEEVAEFIHRRALRPLVVDPVILSSTGARLLEDAAMFAFKKFLIPASHVITPNINEATMLAGREVSGRSQMEDAAKALFDMGAKAVVVKGGHLNEDAIDIFFDGSTIVPLGAKRVVGKTVHGTGCIFSSAIASFLVLGEDTLSSVRKAKEFVGRVIVQGFEGGKGARLPVHPFSP